VRSTEVGRDRGLEATSATTDQVALEALGACSSWSGYPQISRAETAPGWTTWKRCRSSGQTRRSGRSTPEVTRRHNDQSAFSTLPKEHPTGLLRWPLGSSRYACTESNSVSRLMNEAPASEEAGCARVAEATARPEAGGPRAGQVRPRTGPGKAGRRCSPE